MKQKAKYYILGVVAGVFVSFVLCSAVHANTAQTSVTVVITAEVPCTPENSEYSEPCMDLDDKPVVVQNVETPTLWQRFVDMIRFW